MIIVSYGIVTGISLGVFIFGYLVGRRVTYLEIMNDIDKELKRREEKSLKTRFFSF